MSNIQPYIILNDIDSRTISGLLISSLPPISKPLQRTQVETVDGRDGDLVTPLSFSAYDKVITIGLTYGYDIDDVIEYFNSEGVVVFSNEPDKFYRYAIYEQIDFEKLIRFKKAEVTLHCQPFKFSTTEDTKLFNVVSGQAITVKNNGNIYSRPDITVIGSGEVDLSLNGSQVLSLDLSDNQAVIIDSEDMNAYAAQSAIREVIAEVNAYQEGSGDPSPDNERNIIGFNGACINLCGFNVWDEEWELGAFDANGQPVANNNAIRSKNFIPVLPNTTYYFKCGSNAYTSPFEYNADKNFINRIGYIVNQTFTTSSNTHFLKIGMLASYGTTYKNDICINISDASKNGIYEAYIGSKYQSYFEGLTKGTYGITTINDCITSRTTSYSNPVFYGSINGLKAQTGKVAICSPFKAINGQASAQSFALNSSDKDFAINSANTGADIQVFLRCDEYTDVASLKNAFGDVYIIYELASATTPTITQEEITTLLSAFDDTLISVVFGQTVYGGVLDVTNGVLRVTHGYMLIDGNSALSNNGRTDISQRAIITVTGKKIGNVYIISDKFVYDTSGVEFVGKMTQRTINENVEFFLPLSVSDTVASVKQWFADNNTQLVYELATPTIVQLTPAQVNNLLGVNTLYADTGDLTVSHKSNGVIVTNTGAIVSFTVAVDDMEKGALLNRLVTGDYDKIRLKNGDNTIVLTGNAQQFVIDKYSRWI